MSYVRLLCHAILMSCFLQSLWDPALRESREAPVLVRLILFLYRHLLHCGLWGCDATDLALQAACGHPDLCCSGGAPTAGKKTGFTKVLSYH